MSRPIISVITPSYNQVDFLEKNLQSVRDQGYTNIEHIVVDGGSNDGSVDLLREYENQYNLRWISESDRGQSHAVNKGIDMAKGKWIGWQNSDDFYPSGTFDAVVELIESNQNTDVIYGDTLFVDENGNEITRNFHTRPSKFVQKYWSLFASNQSTFIHCSVWEDIGGLDEDLYYTMDAKLMWELLEGDYCYHCVHQPLGAFRVQKNAKTFHDVEHKQRKELNEIYPQSWYESLLSRTLLEIMAKTIKATYLFRDRRWTAFKYNLSEMAE